MNPRRWFLATAALAALTLTLLASAPARTAPDVQVDPVALASALADSPAPKPDGSPVPVARRALRWLLAAEAGRRRPLPQTTFARPLERELRARPPKPAPAPVRLVAMREQSPLLGARRVLATLRRAGRRDVVTLLVVCRPACRVAAVE